MNHEENMREAMKEAEQAVAKGNINMKVVEPVSVYSNIAFLLPLYFSFVNKFYALTILIGFVFVISILYHGSKPPGSVWGEQYKLLNSSQKLFFWSDIWAAIALVSLNFIIYWQKGFPNPLYLVLLILFAFLFFSAPKKVSYDFSQGVWHVMSAAITMFVILI